MSKFWQMPDNSVIINLDSVTIVRTDKDGSLSVYLPEWETAIHIKTEWARAFLLSLMER